MIIDIKKLGIQHLQVSANDYAYDGESRTISGYGAIFNNVDRDGDVLLPGCFAKSIAERGPESDANGKILFLWQHGTDEPLGRITVLREDEKGLYFEAVIDEIELGDRCIKQLESGTLNQFSIGFSYVWDAVRYDELRDAYIVGEVKLYEISVVSIAANPETEYLGLKGQGHDPVDDLNAELAAFMKGMPIERQQKLQSIMAKAISLASSKPAKEPLVEDKQADTPKSIFDCFKI